MPSRHRHGAVSLPATDAQGRDPARAGGTRRGRPGAHRAALAGGLSAEWIDRSRAATPRRSRAARWGARCATQGYRRVRAPAPLPSIKRPSSASSPPTQVSRAGRCRATGRYAPSSGVSIPAWSRSRMTGARAYAETYDLLYRRNAERPNEIWQADHTLLDICEDPRARHRLQPWLTLIEDDYSRAIAGYRLFWKHPPHSRPPGLAPGDLAQGRSPLAGLRHSRDLLHRSRQRLHLAASRTGRGRPEDSARLFDPGVPRGRGQIERLFRTIEQRLLAAIPGYAPPGNDRVAPVLTLSAFEAHLRACLLDRTTIRSAIARRAWHQ